MIDKLFRLLLYMILPPALLVELAQVFLAQLSYELLTILETR